MPVLLSLVVCMPGATRAQDNTPPPPSPPPSPPASDALPPAPAPLLAADRPVPWWVAFKFNAASFPHCAGAAQRRCPFGGTVQDYRLFSQQYLFTAAGGPPLGMGADCLGDDTADPLGATFGQVYDGGGAYYVIWNDQFYDAPAIRGCDGSCGAPWGHAKGMLAWNDQGQGVVLQVSTPSWPAAGSSATPRQGDGNSLGCIKDDDVEVSQHFFALALGPGDVAVVLKALANASVVTDPGNPQIVRNGGPADIQALVQSLGRTVAGTAVTDDRLSGGVRLISKPSALHVPPWQLVSATLGGVPLRVASWWAEPEIPSAPAGAPACWADGLGTPGAVEIATTGTWGQTVLGLKGGEGADFNHAKIGVSTDPARPVTVFGDMNQQGALSGNCGSSQNGRGGLFFVLEDTALHAGFSALLQGAGAPGGP
ncbi:deoxyribonuclease II family protein [Rhodocista pekingensis]|uniref:Deoxyribonuclease II family protein n=1 Tax=Rhodocista pekingensis TaxID=201185 RepID=A0ABW2KTZ1_9PROT